MEYIYQFFPMFANGMVALSLLFRLYKRSISAFITFIAIAMTTNIIYAGRIEYALILLMLFMIIIMARAMTKSDADRFFRHREHDRRSTDSRLIKGTS